MLIKLRKHLTRLRFKSRDLNVIENIPLELANSILEAYIVEGWELGREYSSPCSLQFQGKCLVRRGQSTLIFAYNQDHLGSITGPTRIVSAIAKQRNLISLSSPTWR